MNSEHHQPTTGEGARAGREAATCHGYMGPAAGEAEAMGENALIKQAPTKHKVALLHC